LLSAPVARDVRKELVQGTDAVDPRRVDTLAAPRRHDDLGVAPDHFLKIDKAIRRKPRIARILSSPAASSLASDSPAA